MNRITNTAEGEESRTRLLVLSAILGAVAAFVLFVLFLQTAAVSLTRLGIAAISFVAISAGHYWLAGKWLVNRNRPVRRAAAFGLVLTAIFLPLLYPAPPFPLSPLLRPWGDLAVQFEVPSGSGPLLLPQDGVRLLLDKEVLGASAFNLVGSWKKTPSGLQLATGATGALQWTGTVPDTITLAIQPPSVDCTLTVYWNNIRTSAQLHAGDGSPILIVEKVPVPWGYSVALFISAFILLAWMLTVLGVLFERCLASAANITSREIYIWAIVVVSVILAALTVKLQVDSLSGGVQNLTTVQLTRHMNVLEGHAPNPWQYRVLSEWIAEFFIRVSSLLSIPDAVAVGFIALRVGQNIAIFLLAFALYKKLSGSGLMSLVGILILAASMTNAYYDNDLAFNTYFDVAFYLLAALLLLSHRYSAVVILAVIAALNRETGGIIPFLMAAAILEGDARPKLRKLAPALLALALFAAVFFVLRWVYPARPIYIPYKHPPGVPLLLYNVTRQFTWDQLWRTLGLAPLLGLVSLPAWPRLWKWFFIILCPIWFLIHAFAAVMAETRLFLVPQALIFIPGVLFLLGWLADSENKATSFPSLKV